MNKRWKLHIIFWLAYTLFETYIEFAWTSSSFKDMSVIKHFTLCFFEELCQLPIKIPFVYAILYIGYSYWPMDKQKWRSVLAVVVATAIAIVLHRFLVIKFLLPVLYKEESGNDMLFELQRMISTFLDLAFVIGMAIVGKQYRINQQLRENEKGLIKERLEAELKFLRTQTNPHFLFNTLNNIYALARKKSDDTAPVVMKLSKLLRFMLYESGKNKITISEEIRVLDDYIDLEKIRYNNRLTIHFDKAIDDEQELIAPLILLPFLENAFKHGASETRFDSFIKMNISLIGGQLEFHIENSKEENKETELQEHIGLSNVKRQLQLMYPQHRLEINNDKHMFSIQLKINLYNYATS